MSYLPPNHYDFIVSNIVYVVEKKPNPRWSLVNSSTNNFYVLRFSTQGEVVFNINNKQVCVKEGDLIFFPKNTEQKAHSRIDNPWAFFSVAFDVSFYNEYSKNAFDQFPRITHCNNVHKFSVLFHNLNQAWLGKEIGYLIKCKSILMEILYLLINEVHLSSTSNAQQHNIEKVLKAIQTNYAKTYSIDELAKIARLSPSYFRLVFKRTTGMTAIQYQNQIKISKAKDFLISGNYNVSEVADHVGFNNIYYFSELFKKTTGVSPSNYLKKEPTVRSIL